MRNKYLMMVADWVGSVRLAPLSLANKGSGGYRPGSHEGADEDAVLRDRRIFREGYKEQGRIRASAETLPRFPGSRSAAPRMFIPSKAPHEAEEQLGSAPHDP